MSADRVNNAEADEDGGGRDGEFFSTGKPLSTVDYKEGCDGITYETISPAENHKGMEEEESR